MAADDAYVKSEHLTGVVNMYDTMYLTHNIHFLAAACMMEGRADCAIGAANRLVAHVEPEVPANKQVEWYLPTQPWVLTRFGRWDDILKAPAPSSDLFVLGSMWHYARGAAYTALKQPDKAAIERKALAEAMQNPPANLEPDFNNSAKSVFELSLTALDARMAEASGDRKEAIVLWKKAVDLLDTFAYNEPADWYYPVRESLGGALLRDHQAVEAEAVFRKDLYKNPNSGRSLFGLWQSLLMEHRDSDAALVKTQFDAAWAHSDISLRIADL
jgi:tetratricopeptide (TPR) repeat protein